MTHIVTRRDLESEEETFYPFIVGTVTRSLQGILLYRDPPEIYGGRVY